MAGEPLGSSARLHHRFPLSPTIVRAATDDHKSTRYTDIVNATRASIAGAAVAGVVVAVAVFANRPTPGPGPANGTPTPVPSASTSAPPPQERAPAVVVFTRLGPRKANLVLKVPGKPDQRLGPLEVGADGHVMGEALILIPTRARGIALRRVVLRVPEGLDARVTQAAQTLLVRGGAGSTEVAPLTSKSS